MELEQEPHQDQEIQSVHLSVKFPPVKKPPGCPAPGPGPSAVSQGVSFMNRACIEETKSLALVLRIWKI